MVSGVLRARNRQGKLAHMTDDLIDRLTIRALIENWVLWRDARDWARFRTVWHDDGHMMATWFQGTAEAFIAVSQEGYDRGVRILHSLGGMTIDLAGPRAVAQTICTISLAKVSDQPDGTASPTGRKSRASGASSISRARSP